MVKARQERGSWCLGLKTVAVGVRMRKTVKTLAVVMEERVELPGWHSPFSIQPHAVLQGNSFNVQIWKPRAHEVR